MAAGRGRGWLVVIGEGDGWLAGWRCAELGSPTYRKNARSVAAKTS